GSFTVTALDAYSNTATGYRGSVHFSSSDPLALLPANYTFAAGDNGVHTFSATPDSAGTQLNTVKDTNSNSITRSQTGITLPPAAPTTLVVSGFSLPTTLPT